MGIRYIKFLDLTPEPELRSQLDVAYEKVMSHGRYLRSGWVQKFEEEWAGYVGTRYCVAMQSGSEALRFLVGRRAVVVPWNSQPTIEALRDQCKVMMGSTGSDYNMKPNKAHSLAVQVPVHMYGNPAPMDAYVGDIIYEDACQAHGARYKGQMCGTLAKAAAWSFYPTKNLGAYGDAGAVTTDSEQIASTLRMYRHARMDALQAAFLSVKLHYLDSWNARRREIAAQYKEKLQGVTFPKVNEGAEPNYHIFCVISNERDELMCKLQAGGVETIIHYPCDPDVLSLPCNPKMSDEDVEYVIEKVNESCVP